VKLSKEELCCWLDTPKALLRDFKRLDKAIAFPNQHVEIKLVDEGLVRVLELQLRDLIGQRFPCKPSTIRALRRLGKSRPIVVLAFVEAEHLLGEIAVEMTRVDVNARSANRALEDGPEAFNVIRVDVPTHVFVQVVIDCDRRMQEVH